MKENKIGDVCLTSDGRSLTIAHRNQPDFAISLDHSGVQELLDFLTSLLEGESNRRQAFRVALWEACGLSVEIGKDGDRRSAIPKEISLTGLFVELQPDDSFQLALDDQVEINLQFDGEEQSHNGIIRRCVEDGYGIFFDDSMRGEQINPASGITQIVMELQRRWITRNQHKK